jgi:alpha-amylase
MKKLNNLKSVLSALCAVFFITNGYAQNDAMMQAFYWNVPVDEAGKNGTWWDNLNGKANELKNAGIIGLWIPAPSKGNWGITDMGYGVFDHYDLGNYNQKGTTETRFGSRTELTNMINTMHSTLNGKPRINVYADIVLNHIYSKDIFESAENEQVNPAVKQYVFDQAVRGGTQYVPYPSNEIKWVIPASAGTGDYYIKIKGYALNWGGSEDLRGYDLQIDYTGGGFNSTFSWEFEPNNGGGSFNVFPGSGQTVRGKMTSSSDVDEYRITKTSATANIVIRLTAKKWENSSWQWAAQENGYYPFEIWRNGVNLATSVLQARTGTNITYVNHTGPGEANYTWTYSDFHPVDANDFLTGWDWNGGNDAIIPNTKGFGNDFNTFSTTVKTRLKNWGVWMSNTIGFDGYRLDFVRGYQLDFAREWIANLPLLNGSQRFIVGEYWGPDFRIKEWVNGLAANGVDADGFDFPLKGSLTGMCNGNATFDMRGLNHAGMVRNNSGNSLPGTSVVTWIENHDTGKEHDKWITKDWKMGYAYILTHEGRPCIFYPHYYGVTLVDNHDATKTVTIPSTLKDDINKLLFVRKTYLGGTISVLSETGNPYPAGDAQNVYVARRQGNGTKSGAIIVINNHDTSTKSLWVNSTPAGFQNWAGVTLVNAFNSSQTTVVQPDGRVNVSAPARGYTVWVRQNEYVAYVAPSLTSAGGGAAEDEVAFEEGEAEDADLKVFPNPANHRIIISNEVKKANASYSIAVYNNIGQLIMSKEIKTPDNTYELSTGSFKAGDYIIKLKSEKGGSTRRVYIEH